MIRYTSKEINVKKIINVTFNLLLSYFLSIFINICFANFAQNFNTSFIFTLILIKLLQSHITKYSSRVIYY